LLWPDEPNVDAHDEKRTKASCGEHLMMLCVWHVVEAFGANTK
jgi:hypothetical protein